MSLAPGDMVVVVLAPNATSLDHEIERAHRVIGRTVVLIKVCDCQRCGHPLFASRAPYWIISGCYAVHSIGYLSLRKIPPADLGMDVLTEEEVTL